MKQDKEKPETSIPAEEQKAQPEAPKPAPQASLKEVIAKQAIGFCQLHTAQDSGW